MSGHVATVLHGVYRGEYRVRGDSNTHRSWVVEPFDVAIPRIAVEDAPIAFELERDASRVIWRSFEGRLMREMQNAEDRSTGHWPLESNFNVNCLVGHNVPMRDHPEYVDELLLAPTDQEFRFPQARSAIENLPSTSSTNKDGQFWKWIRDERESAKLRVEAMAPKMAIIEGTVYRPAAPPVICVRMVLKGGDVEVRLEEIIPENIGDKYALAYFAYDRLEAARSFAQAYAAAPPFDIGRKHSVSDHTGLITASGVWTGASDEHLRLTLASALKSASNSMTYSPRNLRSVGYDGVYAATLLALTPPAAGLPVFTVEQSLDTCLRIGRAPDSPTNLKQLSVHYDMARACEAQIDIDADATIADLRF